MIETPQAAARRLAAGAIRDGYRFQALHGYCDADGRPLFWRIRCKRDADGEKWIRPMKWTGAEYVIGELPAAPAGKPLYRLPELVAADPAAPVLVTEGETCADALARLGIIATTSGGSSSADGADWTPLRGRRVVIWPDNDPAGRKYADAVRAILRGLGCAIETIDARALHLPDKGDAVDWLATHPDATAADVDALPRVTSAANDPPRKAAVELRRFSDIPMQPIRWLWPGWLALGKLHILAGAPGTGKTTIAIALAATVSSGGRWPDGSRATRGNVLIWSGEDDAADTLGPRLRAAGADMARVFHVGTTADEDGPRPFDPAQDMAALEYESARIGDVALLIADPVVNAVAGDSHKNTEVRRALQPLVDLGHRLSCAVLGITHFTKGTAGREPLERVTGSLAFGALARIVLATAKREDQTKGPSRILARVKSNIGPDGGGFGYALESAEIAGVETSRVAWGAAVDGSARELLGPDTDGDDARISETRDAAAFLRELLDAGPMPVPEVKRAGSDAGYSWRTLQRAMRKIGVESERQGFGQPSVWRLMGDNRATVAPLAPTKLLGATGATGATEDAEDPFGIEL